MLPLACGVNTRYIAAPSTPPPDLGIAGSDGAVIVSVSYLIIQDSQGSWVKGAKWDEYIVAVRNLSTDSVAIEKIRIVDPRGVYIETGADPYQLETASEALMQAYKDMGISTAITFAPTALMLIAGAAPVGLGAAMLGPIGLIAGPVYYFASQQAQMEDKESIVKEFNRRRMIVPVTIAGNATVLGSAFFPVIPNPRSLAVDYRVGPNTKTIEVSLEKLKGLHVAPAEKSGEKKQ
jgi:hypothetical protein